MVLIGVGDVSGIVVLDDIGLVEGEIDSHSASNLPIREDQNPIIRCP